MLWLSCVNVACRPLRKLESSSLFAVAATNRFRIFASHWPGLRHCILSLWSQRAARSDVSRNLSTSTVYDDTPPSPICYGDLARLVEDARSPLKGRGLRTAEVPRSVHDCQYQYKSTLRGWSISAASTARSRDRKKGRQSNIDANHLLDLVLEQDGLCAYSGIPMGAVEAKLTLEGLH